MSTKLFGNMRQKFFDGNLLYPLLSIKCFDTSNYLKHWRDAPRSFSVLWDSKFSQKKRDILYYTWNFSIPHLFWNIERQPTKNFGTVRQKIFNWKMRYPLLCINFYVTPKLSESLKGCPQNFSALWDWNFSQKKRYILYYTRNFSIPQLFWNLERKPTKNFGTVRQKNFNWKMRYPLLCINFYVTPKLSESLKGCPQNFSALWDRNFSQEKRDFLYYTWNFSIPQLFWNIERMPTKIFGTRRPKSFAEKTFYLLLCTKFFDTLIFLKPWRNVHKTFWQCETKIFRRKFVIPPIIRKIFRYLKLSGTLKGCPKKFFGIMRSKIFAGKRDTLYFTWNFSTPQVFGNIERMRTNFFGTVRQKVFNGEMWDPLLCIKFPVTAKNLKHWRDAHKIFRHRETTNFWRKNVIPFTIHDTSWYPNFFEALSGCPQKV